jgi:hypothetical protein
MSRNLVQESAMRVMTAGRQIALAAITKITTIGMILAIRSHVH